MRRSQALQLRNDTSGAEAQGVVRLQPRVYLNIRLTLEYRGGHTFCLRKGMIWRQHGDKAVLLTTVLSNVPSRRLTMPKSSDFALMLGLVCSAFGFTFQPVAQSHMDSQRAGLMCALNPAFASILGVLILHESMNIEGVLGAALILSSLFIPHFFSTHQTAHRQHHKTNRQHR